MSRKKLLKKDHIESFSPKTIGDRINLVVAKYGKNGRKFAELVGISTGNLNALINDDSKPGAKFLIHILEHHQINLNWLLTGHGEMTIQATPPGVIDIKHADLVQKFADKPRAKIANECLLKIEQNDRDKFIELVGQLKGIAGQYDQSGIKPQLGETGPVATKKPLQNRRRKIA